MTKEELNKLRSTVKEWLFHTGSLNPNNYADELCKDFIEPREKQIDELKAQIKVLGQNLEDTEICENGLKNRIAELEAQVEKMKQDLDNARENANKQEQWEIYSVLNDIYNDNFEVTTSVSN